MHPIRIVVWLRNWTEHERQLMADLLSSSTGPARPRPLFVVLFFDDTELTEFGVGQALQGMGFEAQDLSVQAVAAPVSTDSATVDPTRFHPRAMLAHLQKHLSASEPSTKAIRLVYDPRHAPWILAGTQVVAALPHATWLTPNGDHLERCTFRWELPEAVTRDRPALGRPTLPPQAQLPLELSGESEVMQRLRRDIDGVANNDAPLVFLTADGLSAQTIAAYCHDLWMPRAFQSFRLFPSAAGLPPLLERRSQLKDFVGTFFFSNIQLASANHQRDLARYLASLNAPRSEQIQAPLATMSAVAYLETPRRSNVRVIASFPAHSDFEFDSVWSELRYARHIRLPPLREREDDILFYANEILQQTLIARDFEPNAQSLHPDVQTRLRNYNWPGNFDELRSVIAEASQLAHLDALQEIQLRHIDAKTVQQFVLNDWSSGDLRSHIFDTATAIWQTTLQQYDTGVAAARALGFDTKQDAERFVERLRPTKRVKRVEEQASSNGSRAPKT